jgi:hypothetical protein
MGNKRRMPMKFRYRQDPGHGWLIVTPDDMAAVGLTEADISAYSYRRGNQIALEEDCDMWTFAKAYEALNGRLPDYVSTIDGAEIRNWDGYGTKPYEAFQEAAQ